MTAKLNKKQKPTIKRNQAAHLSSQLAQKARLLESAERIAHLGSWEFELLHEDLSKNPLRWSDEVFRIFGYQAGEIKVSLDNFFKAVHPEDRERVRQNVAKMIKQRVPRDIVHRIVLPDATVRIVRERSDIIFDKSKKPLRMIGICQDITEQTRTEMELKEKEEILSAAQTIGRIGSWHMDIEETENIFDNTMHCSQAACDLFGKKNGRMKAKLFFSSVHPEDHELITNMLNKAIRGHTSLDIEHRIKTKDGSVRYVKQRLKTIQNNSGQPARVIGTVQDITDFVHITQKLASRAVELEMLNKSMINRELKMIELKKEIAELKKQTVA